MGLLRSGRRFRQATPEEELPGEEEGPAEEEGPTGVWHPVWVSIYDGDGVFRHWSLFVEDEQDPGSSFIIHVMGQSGGFRYEQRLSNAHACGSLREVIEVGYV